MQWVSERYINITVYSVKFLGLISVAFRYILGTFLASYSILAHCGVKYCSKVQRPAGKLFPHLLQSFIERLQKYDAMALTLQQ